MDTTFFLPNSETLILLNYYDDCLKKHQMIVQKNRIKFLLFSD